MNLRGLPSRGLSITLSVVRLRYGPYEGAHATVGEEVDRASDDGCLGSVKEGFQVSYLVGAQQRRAAP